MGGAVGSRNEGSGKRSNSLINVPSPGPESGPGEQNQTGNKMLPAEM